MVLHVANFNYARGGLWEPIHFGRAGQIQRSGSILLGYDVFLVGALVIMGLYHVGLFALRRQDMYTLMFGLFALLLAMRSIFRGEMFIYTLLPDFPFVWHVRLEYLGFYLAMPLFLWFILLVFNSPLRRSDRAIAVLVSVLAAGFIVPVLLGDPGFFTHMVVWYQALTVVVSIVVIGAVLLPAVRAGKPGSWFAGGAFILFFAAILNDILRMNLVIHTSEMAPTGFMFFTFAQAFMLSQRSAQSYQRVERLTEANARFVPQSFISFLKKRDITEVHLGDSIEREMTIMFIDIRGFTGISQQMTPEASFKFINMYLHDVGPLIRRNGGFIDKYLGDGVMALFPDSIAGAAAAAIDVQNALQQMPWPSDSPGIRAGIGLHHGMLRLGTVGEQARLDVTVVSRVVNLAARLEKLTRRFDTGIIVSETIQAALPDREMRRLGSVRVKGIAEYITVYELLDGLPEGMRSARIQHRDAFDSAMNSLQAGRTEEANRAFRRILEEDPGDAAARYYLSQSAVV